MKWLNWGTLCNETLQYPFPMVHFHSFINNTWDLKFLLFCLFSYFFLFINFYMFLFFLSLSPMEHNILIKCRLLSIALMQHQVVFMLYSLHFLKNKTPIPRAFNIYSLKSLFLIHNWEFNQINWQTTDFNFYILPPTDPARKSAKCIVETALPAYDIIVASVLINNCVMQLNWHNPVKVVGSAQCNVLL